MGVNHGHGLPLMNHLPSIDLHGEDRITAGIMVRQFIDDCYRLHHEKLLVIHGIGSGILKKEVHEVLKNNRKVERYYVDFFNVGCTVVELRENIDK